MKTTLTVTEISSLLGKSRQAVHKRAAKEGWPCQDGGGKALYPVDSLPPDIRRLYLSSVSAPANVIAFPEQKPSPAKKPEPIRNMTPSQERTALARADLINYIKARKAEARKAGRPLTGEAQATVDLYNNGFILKDVFGVLGNVNVKTAYRWEKALKEASGNYSALAPRYGHNRGESMLTDIEREIFLKVLLQPNHPPVGTAIRVAKEVLRHRGLSPASSDASWRRFSDSYREQNYHIWTLAREGEKALNDKVLPYLERDASLLEVGDVLVADGHPLNFQVLDPWTGKPTRAAMVLYLDWRSRFPCGFEIMLTEDVQCIHSALRRAILTLGKIPGNALLDNGKAFKAKVFMSDVDLEQAGLYGLYGRLGINVRLARAYNAQDKLVERFFRTFGDWVERLMPSFIGASIGDKPAYMQRNEKFHKSMHNSFVPTIGQAMELVAKGLEGLYCSQPHSGLGGRTPREVFDEGRGPGVDEAGLNFLMMSQDVRTIYRNGVRLLGGHYWNEALVGYKGRAIVKYDMHDLARVLVYDEHGGFLCEAARVRQNDPLMRGDEDLAALKKLSKDKASIKSTLKAAVRAVNGDVRKLPELDWQRAVDTVPGLPEMVEAEAAAASAEPEFFEQGWQRYEHLIEKDNLTREEERWIEAYRSGDICPGEYESIYACHARAAGQ